MSDDDWRATLTITGEGKLKRLLEHMRGEDIADEVRRQGPSGVVVSQDDEELHFYSAARADVEAATRIAQDVAAQHHLEVGAATLEHWHPEEEAWEPASQPLPQTPEEHARERATLADAERAESRAEGVPAWEVDLELPDHAAAVALSTKLEGEGIPNRRASKFVRIAAETEDDARALATRLRGEVPPGTEVSGPLGSQADAWGTLHPFAFLGGLGN